MPELKHKKTSKMYPERKGNISWFRGCGFNCTYCAFKNTLRFQECPKCKAFEPHAHLRVLDRAPPHTKSGEFLTMGLTGDIAFATAEEMLAAIAYCCKWSDRTFLIQTKAPDLFTKYDFPENVILDTTIESDIDHGLSYAPSVRERHRIMTSRSIQALFNPIWITIEPILKFSDKFVDWIKEINPSIVYIGYDSKNNQLSEPSLNKTMELIEQLKQFTTVRTKLLRKAWYEPD